MTEKKNVRFELDRLTDALVEDILNASDEEILSEAEKDYGDLNATITRTRALYDNAISTVAKQKLIEAKKIVKAEREQEKNVVSLDPDKARRRLERILENDPEIPNKITLAARKGKDLSDQDVLGMLEDLDELGISSLYDNEDSED